MKNYKPKNGGPPGDDDVEVAPMILTTTDGNRYRLVPISDTKISLALAAIEKRYRERGEPLDPPTYTVTLAGGATETYPHDEKSAKDTGPEAEEAWNAYQDALERLGAEQNERKMRMLLRGIQWEEDPAWEPEHRENEIDVPTDPAARWWHFLTTEILKTPDDLFGAVEAMTILAYKGAINEEAIRAGVESFRDSLREHSAEAVALASRQVEAQDEHVGGGNSV